MQYPTREAMAIIPVKLLSEGWRLWIDALPGRGDVEQPEGGLNILREEFELCEGGSIPLGQRMARRRAWGTSAQDEHPWYQGYGRHALTAQTTMINGELKLTPPPSSSVKLPAACPSSACAPKNMNRWHRTRRVRRNRRRKDPNEQRKRTSHRDTSRRANDGHDKSAETITMHVGVIVEGYLLPGDGLAKTLTGADNIVIPAGVPRKPGMTRKLIENAAKNNERTKAKRVKNEEASRKPKLMVDPSEQPYCLPPLMLVLVLEGLLDGLYRVLLAGPPIHDLRAEVCIEYRIRAVLDPALLERASEMVHRCLSKDVHREVFIKVDKGKGVHENSNRTGTSTDGMIETTRSLHRRQRYHDPKTTQPTLHHPSIRVGSRSLSVVGVRPEGEGKLQLGYTPDDVRCVENMRALGNVCATRLSNVRNENGRRTECGTLGRRFGMSHVGHSKIGSVRASDSGTIRPLSVRQWDIPSV
ncbi:hypothetical protein EDB83DRAFT_2323089 [Lactarius deliciosus]|nr:hypothetical protein EDB83DRAFT_2323089 [Lactarius deliciosus]